MTLPADPLPPIPILARTDWWIAVDKPSGLPSRPGPGHPESVLSLLERWLPLHAPGLHPPGVVHRLDLETSGLLLFSLHPEGHRRLVRAFARGEIHKLYEAVVLGAPRPRRGLIDAPLRRNRSGLSVPDPHGRPARTRYETARRFRGASHLTLEPLTGRRHQIRVHLTLRGNPILGDGVYGASFEDDPRGSGLPEPPRLCLHARRLLLPPDLARGRAELEAPLPSDLRAYLRALALGAAGRE